MERLGVLAEFFLMLDIYFTYVVCTYVLFVNLGRQDQRRKNDKAAHATSELFLDISLISFFSSYGISLAIVFMLTTFPGYNNIVIKLSSIAAQLCNAMH